MNKLLLILTGCSLASICALSCAKSPDGSEIFTVQPMPDREAFVTGNVSLFMEARCGAIDCHGQVGRPLRIYSQNGLRFETAENGDRDTRETTPEERLENYKSVVGLEPEDIARSVDTGGQYVDFQLMKKPLGIEGGGMRHKGGPVLIASDKNDGWVCLKTWLAGTVDSAACDRAKF